MTSRQGQILIVDDEATIRLLASRALKLDGHTCFEAESGVRARASLVDRGEISLVVCDINMPGESGLDLVRWIVEYYPDTAVLMATGDDDRSVADEAIALGVYGYLIKPFKLNELRITVANALRRRQLEHQQRARSQSLQQLVEERTAALEETASSLRDGEDRLHSLVSSVPLGVLYSDLDGHCEYVNDAAAELGGCDVDQLLGFGFFEVVHPEDVEMVVKQLALIRKRRRPGSIEHRLLRPDGTEVTALTRVAPVVDRAGVSTAFVAVVSDVTEQKRFERQLAYQATHDELTGLPNRQLLVDRIESMLAMGSGVVMLIDLDRFKLVNDIHGHTAGDRLLVEAAKSLSAAFSRPETVGRFGGDEFVVVSHADSDAAVSDAANRILSALSGLEHTQGHMIAVSASIGVARMNRTSTAEELLRHADIAMYKAKERGGSRFEVFDDELGRHVQERVLLEGQLHNAIERDQFEMHYQPKVDCFDGSLRGVEALIRWRHPARGLLPPAVFLPIANEAGMMEDLTDLVLRRVFQQAVDWSVLTPNREPVPVAVNIGANELDTDGLRTRVAKLLVGTGLDPRSVTLELTEGSLIHDLGRSAIRLEALRNLGVRTSLDDFGTGYSSLSYLSRLPLDELKIDRAFVQRMGQSTHTPDATPPDRQLVEAIIRLASIFELDVVAEGIESHHELEMLRRLGCNTAQGYLIGRPTTPDHPSLESLIRGNPLTFKQASSGTSGQRR